MNFWGNSRITLQGVTCNEPIQSSCSPKVFRNICLGFVSYMPHKNTILLCFVADDTYYLAGENNFVPLRRSKEVIW